MHDLKYSKIKLGCDEQTREIGYIIDECVENLQCIYDGVDNDTSYDRIRHVIRVTEIALGYTGHSYPMIKEVVYAAMYHDIAKFIDEPRHNSIGAEMVSDIIPDNVDSFIIREAIYCHNKSKTEGVSTVAKIIADSDRLDKLLIETRFDVLDFENPDNVEKLLKKVSKIPNKLYLRISKEKYDRLYNRLILRLTMGDKFK